MWLDQHNIIIHAESTQAFIFIWCFPQDESEKKNKARLQMTLAKGTRLCKKRVCLTTGCISNWTLHPYDVCAVLMQQISKSLPTNGLCHLRNSNGTSNLEAVVWASVEKQQAIRPGHSSWATVLQIATTAVTTTGEKTVAKQQPDARP